MSGPAASRYRPAEWLDIRGFWYPDTATSRLLIEGPCVLVAVVTAESPSGPSLSIYDGTDAAGRLVWRTSRNSSGRNWWLRLDVGLFVSGSGLPAMFVAAPLSVEARREAARYE